MLLQNYLEMKSIRAARFAEEISVPASTVTRILRGERRPGLALIEKITKATEGAVRAEDFFGIPPAANSDGAAA